MKRDQKYTTIYRGIFLTGIIFLLHIATGYAQQVTDTTSKKIAADTNKAKAVVTTTDTTVHVSKALEEIRKRKGTHITGKGDQALDTVNQKIIQTSDQHLDVIKEKEITDTLPKGKGVASDKAPNTQALPTTASQIINTLDGGSGFTDTKQPGTTDSTGAVKNHYNAALQTRSDVQLNSLFTTTLLHDSMMAEGNKDFLFNSVTITNVSSAKLSLLVTIVIPNGWQTVTDKVVTIDLQPNENKVIYMQVAPVELTSPGWKQVRIEYRNVTTGETRNDFYSVRVKEFSRFKAKLLNPNMVLPGFQRIITVPVYIKNSGNTNSQYTIGYVNDFFNLDGKSSIELGAGSDTTYNLSLVINENEWTMLKKEEVRVSVASNGDAYNLIETISRIGYILKDHSSAYLDMPLQFEAGATSQAGTAIQYYGAVYGSVDIDNDNKVALAVRTNTVSKDQVIDNSLVRMDYTGKHVTASIGNIMEMTDFLMDGYGAKLGYNWGKHHSKAVVYAELQSRTGDTKVIGSNLQFGLTDNVKILSTVSTDIDNLNKLNSSITRQTLDMKLGANTKLALIGGASMEQTQKPLINNTANSLIGTTFGYNLQFVNKHLSILSSASYNDNNFAGVYKGQRLQTHDVRVIANKIFVGGYYEYNYREQTSFYDSVLMKNVFGLSSQNYGGRVGVTTKFGNIVLSGGQQVQRQSGEGNDFDMIFNYANLNTTINLLKKVNLNLTSYTGEGSAPDKNVNNVFISSNMGTLNVYNSGITFRYDQGPFYYSDFSTYIQNPTNMVRLMVSPFVDLQLFKQQFSMRVQYNYAQTQPDGGTTGNVILNLAYVNSQKGYDVHLTGTLPTIGETQNTYLNASVRMRLKAPCVLIRKYYKVRFVLFKDGDGDGQKGNDEEPIVGQMLSVNGNLFISDENGMLIYANVEKGAFKVDFGYTSRVKGWAPRDGITQSFDVKGNVTYYIPYRKSRVLSGKLNVQIDSNSNLKFDPSKIKVTATSDDNVSYSTLTDENGEFFFNVPSGHYTVSLSQVAFDEHFRPTQFSQQADMQNNESKMLYFEIRQRRREINIHKE